MPDLRNADLRSLEGACASQRTGGADVVTVPRCALEALLAELTRRREEMRKLTLTEIQHLTERDTCLGVENATRSGAH